MQGITMYRGKAGGGNNRNIFEGGGGAIFLEGTATFMMTRLKITQLHRCIMEASTTWAVVLCIFLANIDGEEHD